MAGSQVAHRVATRPFLPQHDRTTLIVSHEVKRVLADIDADQSDRTVGLLRHGVLVVFAAPGQPQSLAGARARPDRPISRHSTNEDPSAPRSFALA
jgi:hypothetical protein